MKTLLLAGVGLYAVTLCPTPSYAQTQPAAATASKFEVVSISLTFALGGHFWRSG